jgi:tetratricopeptide (TPR) repeat protein
MSSTQVAQSDLDRGLVQLETLVLIRPPNVLLAEYLSALAAEDVLDAATAAQVSRTLNGLRYSVVPLDDGQIGEAAASLVRATDRLAAMSPEDRKQIAERVRNRIQRPAAEPAQHCQEGCTTDAPRTPVPPARQNHATRPNHEQSAIGQGNDRPFESIDPQDELIASLPQTNRRRGALPRISLELTALAALGTFFGGYFFRDAANKVADASALPVPFPTSPKRRPVLEAWVETTRALGDAEAQAEHYPKARLALELALAYSPEDAKTLNNLAWYYLLSEKSGTNPQRALKLVNRALELSRLGTYLDTAAEAHFQLGDFGEAVRLEREALITVKEEGERVDLRFLQRQLKKFEDAERAHSATPVSPTAK